MGNQILWTVAAPSEALFIARLATIIQDDYGIKSMLLTPFETSQLVLTEHGFSSMGLWELLTDYFTDLDRDGIQEIIDAANSLLKNIDIKMLLHSDALLSLFVEKDLALNLIARTVIAFNNLFNEYDFSCCLRYGTGGFFGRIMSIIAESCGIPSYALISGVGFNTCGLSPAGIKEQWTWTSFQRLWNSRHDYKPNPTEQKFVDEYIKSYYMRHRSRPRSLLQMSGVDIDNNQKVIHRKVKTIGRNILKFMDGKKSRREHPEGNSIVDFVATGRLDALIPMWGNYQSTTVSNWLWGYRKFRYDEIPERFVYMPLNFSWDAPHRSWNPMNYLQEYLVMIVAASLPSGYELVIKEHPYGLGNPSHTVLKRFQNNGIKVVNPHTHSLELVKKSNVVFCVGDTTGWEGLLFKTPVIVFGARPFYTSYPKIWVVDDPNKVHHLIREAVRFGNGSFANEAQWYSFIHCALESSHSGNIWGYKEIVWENSDSSIENLKKISLMIANESSFRQCKY